MNVSCFFREVLKPQWHLFPGYGTSFVKNPTSMRRYSKKFGQRYKVVVQLSMIWPAFLSVYRYSRKPCACTHLSRSRREKHYRISLLMDITSPKEQLSYSRRIQYIAARNTTRSQIRLILIVLHQKMKNAYHVMP